MVPLDPEEADAPEFVREVAALIRAAVDASAPDVVVVVKIDNWFGSNWLGFSHKAMGAFGVASPRNLAIPPFVPNRVRYERAYSRAGESFTELTSRPRLHVAQPSEANERRKLKTIHPSDAIFWWTGCTHQSGRGALMAYLPTPEGHTGWYAELRRDLAWSFGAVRGIAMPELRALRGRAAQLGTAAGRVP